jgi:hypothetical protein
MVEDLFFHELLLLPLLWLCVILHWVGRRRQAVADQAQGNPAKRATRRSQDPKPFPGLTTKPHCGACEPGPGEPPSAAPPPPLHSLYGRPRTVATHHHFCPEPTCHYYGWVGRGNVRANGHPGGGPWRQLSCVACGGYFLETHGTPLHGKRMPAERLVRVVAALAEGLGIRAVARVFEVDPNTVLAWLVEAADHLQAFSSYFLHDVQASGVGSHRPGEQAAPDHRRRQAHAGNGAMRGPSGGSGVSTRLCAPVSDRWLQGIRHGAAHALWAVGAAAAPPGYRPRTQATLDAPARAALCASGQVLPTPARRPHQTPCGLWHPGRRQARLDGGQGWQINTAFIERANLTIRQHVAAVGRRVMTLCKGEAGLRQQLAVYQVYYNFCLPHASLRLPLPQPEPTNGTGSAKRWWPQTPATAVGLTDHVWTLREVLLFRVPPWPQLQVL